jgi:hypothetical protein
LFLKVSDNTTSKTIKLLSAGSGNEGNRISYQGQDGRGSETLKFVSDRTGFFVYLGNQLQFTAHVDGHQERVLKDNPETSQIYTFAISFNYLQFIQWSEIGIMFIFTKK